MPLSKNIPPAVLLWPAFLGIVVPLSDSGDLHDYVDSVRGGEREVALSKLKIAFHVSSGLAAFQGLQSEPNATYTAPYAHNDLDVSQFIINEGIFQLNDFNLGKFIQKRKGDFNVKACFEWPHMATALYHAPEDAAYLLARKGNQLRNKELAELVKGKKVPFDYSKADVFSLGTIMYMVLTNRWMWESSDVHGSLLRLIQGERPPLSDNNASMALNDLSIANKANVLEPNITNNTNNTTLMNATEVAAVNAIATAINMCWIHDPSKDQLLTKLQTTCSSS